ncbi:unnamed protein product [Acanthoscelides obtectus]|nr:unnamed protein product [Acanthoscelides obtectus]CAK1644939.1 V-type proton ATPase subunit S1 [Acanthoscelides obtectus]
MGSPQVFLFRSPSRINASIKEITDGYHSAYNPNAELFPENYTDLLGNSDLDIQKIRQVLNSSKSENVLSAIITPTVRRPKRQSEESAINESSKSIIYRAQNSNNKLFALLYSSKPLLLKRNDSDEFPELHLGRTNDDMVIYDTRLNVMVIPMETTGKVTLRFTFSKVNGYWYMSSVKVTDTNTNKEYNLTTDEDIMAPEYFSYHCNGYSVFSDGNGTELFIYDIQVQIDSKDGKFGDVNDCVTFTTAPIWSGLFVTTILGIGLIVALSAIMDIKTMDKFDNHKTKNLAITISE